MWKRPTRKKLLQALDGLILDSSRHPISQAKIYHVNRWGEADLDTQEIFNNIGDIAGRLMDLSMSHRIVKVSQASWTWKSGMVVVFRVMPDPDYRTNIDLEFMEKIMKLHFDGEGN